MDVRNILMVISLGLSIVIGLLVARGHQSTAIDNSPDTASPLIGLSLDTTKEPRWISDRDLFVARCQALGARVQVTDANGDDTQQAQDMRSLMVAKCKVIVIVPHDAVSIAPSVEEAEKAGIPVISYDRLVRDCDPHLYVSFDNVRVGRQQAQFLVDHLTNPAHSNIVRVYGAPTDNNAKMFKQGQDQVLQPYIDRGQITVVHQDWAEDWKPENAKRILNAALTNGDKFDAVLASNDSTAAGTVQALSEAGLAGKILVTGQDADLDACQRIASGTQTMTVYKPVKKLATLGAECAVALATGKPIVATASVNNGKIDVPSILHDTIAVTKDNLVDVVVKDAFHTYDEIYSQLPESDRPPRPQ